MVGRPLSPAGRERRDARRRPGAPRPAVQLTVSIDGEAFAKLERHALRYGITPNRLARQLIKQNVGKLETQ